ncbi:MAG: thioredoxin domain-containing protein [Flammeovirgaceae bacterium]
MKSNRLIHSSSPYLLQHAHNPVDWFAWGEEALQKAKSENKPILVSIGYAACHWCHVMERESFENEQIAEEMNQHFVCIKVDREERPDIDQIYMDAIQMMGQQGGWPLNVFLTPDAQPFYGGTYFPPQKWINLLQRISQAYREHQEEILISAENFTHLLNKSEIERYQLITNNLHLSVEAFEKMFQTIVSKFDTTHGGMKRAPKFPMPCIYQFLLRYYHLSNSDLALKQILLTLDKMAMGGIYDQIGGGFARYSVDGLWFAPHFEKMLYDNAQLLSLYSEAFKITKNTYYQEIINETVCFLRSELRDKEGGFYSALDADSEGVEGKYYTWKYEELKNLLEDDDLDLFSDFYNVRKEGNWEHGYNILHKSLTDKAFAKEKNISEHQLNITINRWKSKLLEARSRRVKPSLDDKILASWNGLILKGLCDSFMATNEQNFYQLAYECILFLENKMLRADGSVWHTFKNNKSSLLGFLEDYATVIQGFIAFYQISFEEKWLFASKKLMEYCLQHFFDYEEEMFFFTDSSAENLIARKKELFDNVIPASNSIMAQNLHLLGTMLDIPNYKHIAQKMLARVSSMLEVEVQYLSNWACLYADMLKELTEVVIVGENSTDFARKIQKYYMPNVLVLAAKTENSLPLFQNRTAIHGKTTIYVCKNKSCQLPVFSVEDALNLI